MKWSHPEKWSMLRKVQLDLSDGGKKVSSVAMRPAGDGLAASGQVKLSKDSRLTHGGKTVSARLGLRLPKALAGHQLDVGVWAKDAAGHKQVEANVGTVRVK
jgi:hypothetical protein